MNFVVTEQILNQLTADLRFIKKLDGVGTENELKSLTDQTTKLAPKYKVPLRDFPLSLRSITIFVPYDPPVLSNYDAVYALDTYVAQVEIEP